ncbi:hypothetical protein [Hyalangium minutum]|uniref:hypothetical protein n=1 Tax=Hyalangium minutum TaxID=394096 RepID=UPI001F0A602D|nr:hypothetical protein [Hyalangium minutum]
MRPGATPEWGSWAVLWVALCCTACGTASHGVPRQYAQVPDTVSNACLKNPANCPPGTGLRLVPSPPPAPPLPAATGFSVLATSVVGAAVIQVGHSLDADLRARIDAALAECADAARSEVMLKHFGRSPTRQECSEVIGTDSQGQPITRAMQLGVEQHTLALRCAERKLQELKPGGFSIQPRYRVDPETGKAEYLPRQVVENLLRQGRSAELRGTIEPDLVLHEGQPYRVQETYDLKFPCANTSQRVPWRTYPRGHAHEGSNQGTVYREALGGKPVLVQPHLGVAR